MNIRFECEKCGQLLVIDEAGAGLDIQCPSCSADLIVPAVEKIAERQVAIPRPATASGEVEQVNEGKLVICAPPLDLPHLGEQVEYGIKDGFVTIERPNFYGQCSRSPNGRFMVAWNDHDGLYFLLESNRAIAKGKMPRPNDGKVSNSGNFILNDWSGSGETLSGTFYAFAASGGILIRKRFRANLNTNGLSDDGRFAFCDTCRSDCEAHSNKTFIFVLEDRALLSTIDELAGKWYQFDLQYRILGFLEDGAIERRYTFEGKFLGAERLSGKKLTAYADHMERELQKPQHAGTIALMERALERGLSTKYQFKIHRTLGQIFHRCGDTTKAIKHLEAASCIDPTIRVEKLLKRLKSENPL